MGIIGGLISGALRLTGKAAGAVAKGVAKKTTEVVAEKAITEVGYRAAVKIDEKSQKNLEKKKEKIKQENPENFHLFIKQESLRNWKDKLEVLDENENLKYLVKGKFFSTKHKFYIYDSNKNLLGVVKEKSPWITKRRNACKLTIFNFYNAKKEKIAKLKSLFSVVKSKYEFVTEEEVWQVKGDFLSMNYIVSLNETEIAKIYKAIRLMWKDAIIIDFPREKDELLIIMLVMALRSTTGKRKMEELKDELTLI